MVLHNNDPQVPMVLLTNSCNVFLFNSQFTLQSWDSFFRNASAGAEPGQAYQAPPSLALPGRNEVPVSSLATSVMPRMGSSNLPSTFSSEEAIVDDHLAVQAIIRSYQVIISKLISFKFSS